jgi:hypothetical protein
MSIDVRSFFEPYFTPFLLLSLAACWVAVLVALGKLLERTGHSAAWAFFSLLPFVNLLVLLILAFKPWPIERPSNRQNPIGRESP